MEKPIHIVVPWEPSFADAIRQHREVVNEFGFAWWGM